MFALSLLASFTTFASCVRIALAAPTSGSILAPPLKHGFSPRTVIKAPLVVRANTSCTNEPGSRDCWGGGYDIDTDSETSWPTTGTTRYYTLEITNTTMAPDGGQERIVYAINGQYPGPLIEADWGDTVSVTVKNSLQYNGTSIHWHGISQHNTNSMDGVNGVTECALAPGSSKTYTWQATQYGTTWYHSHHSGQYGDGVYGPMVINGPSTADYDIDLGVLPVTDWYYATATQLDMRMVYGAGPPKADNGLLNGTMVSPDGTQGSYAKTTLQPGKTHRLRLINTSVDNHFMVSLDNHQMTLIQADFVAIEPQVVDWVFIAIGQRYDVLITANETVDNYWFRAEVQTPCGSNNNNGNIKSIFSYEGASDSYPTSNGSSYVGGCSDQTGLVPYVQKDVPSDQFQAQSQSLEMLHDLGTKASWSVNGSSVVQWAFNGEMITINWDKPTLDYVFSGESNFSSSQAIIELPNANEWTFWIINSLPTTSGSAPHPIHLHGHDFYVLGAGDGNFTDASTLNYTNPTRRDVAMLPKAGWLVLAFQTDNPGAWLMHCHIAWHVSEGLAVQFLERASEIPNTFQLPSDYTDTCSEWASYQESARYPMFESGL